MVKADLVAKVAQERGWKLSEVQQVVETMFDAMTKNLVEGQGIEIRGFASFKIKEYKAYQGRNPRTGQSISVRPKRGVVFKVGTELRDRVNKAIEAESNPN
jgi:integration host factor subunit beta